MWLEVTILWLPVITAKPSRESVTNAILYLSFPVPAHPFLSMFLRILELLLVWNSYWGCHVDEGPWIVFLFWWNGTTYIIACKKPTDAVNVAQFYIKEAYRVHGLMATIVSDKDTHFLSHFWRSLWQLITVKLNFITAYHLPTDGKLRW